MGLGGALIWTGLIRNLRREFPSKKIIIINTQSFKRILLNRASEEDIIFRNNDDIYLSVNKVKWFFIKNRFMNDDVIAVDMNNPVYIYCERDTEERIFYKTGKHAIQIACDVHGIDKPLLKPKIVLTHEEKKKVDSLLSEINLKNNFICIEPHYKQSFTPNKAWFWDRWQSLVDELNAYISELNLDLKIVQIGIRTDKVLGNVVNFTGKTTFRETAHVLENSLFLISYMGGLIHLSKAVGLRNIVLISPWEPKELASYPDDINFYPEIECQNCGLKIPCPLGRECMKKISVGDVFESCKTLITESLVLG